MPRRRKKAHIQINGVPSEAVRAKSHSPFFPKASRLLQVGLFTCAGFLALSVPDEAKAEVVNGIAAYNKGK